MSKDWTGNSLSAFANISASTHTNDERVSQDYYSTDPSAIDFLLKHETFSPKVWECACGGGNLSKKLESYGYDVYSSDIADRGYGEAGVDFLKQFNKFDGDIITNPPYKHVTEFILKALDLTEQKVAMFCKIQLLETKRRYKEIFEYNPPARVYVFVKRIKCYRNDIRDKKSSAVCYAWFVWDKEYDGEPIVRWLY